MKAAAIRRYKQPVAIVDLPKPSLGPGDLLVKMRAASVNPVDFKIRDGGVKRSSATRSRSSSATISPARWRRWVKGRRRCRSAGTHPALQRHRRIAAIAEFRDRFGNPSFSRSKLPGDALGHLDDFSWAPARTFSRIPMASRACERYRGERRICFAKSDRAKLVGGARTVIASQPEPPTIRSDW